MGIQNSRTEDVLGVIRQMFVDLAHAMLPLVELPSLPASARRSYLLRESKLDYRYAASRTESEGLEFLTTTLPRLGKWLDQGLETGHILSKPDGFAPYGEEGYPVFLRVFWGVLEKGLTSDDEEATIQLARAIRIVRSICFACYKLEVPCNGEQVEKALTAFILNDAACGVPWSFASQRHIEAMRGVVEETMHEDSAERRFDPYDISPRHGPGAVATGEKAEEKWRFKRLYPNLHQAYPYYEFMYGIRENGRYNHLRDRVCEYMALERGAIPTSKVVTVPKDSRGPRIICEEPLEIQYVQQGVARKLMAFIEGTSRAAGHVNFTDQTVNHKLALLASKDQSMATIDMKDASDLVSLELVLAVFPQRWEKFLLATRSTHALLPRGRMVKLEKYAPMGSALCFPIESVVFYASCVATLIQKGLPISVARRSVYVYGDDIIVPTEYVGAVMHDLEMIGLRVNHDKSCYRANFRESCGVDAWKGNLVTPVRIRKFSGQRPSDGVRHMAWCKMASQLWEAGMYHASMATADILKRVLRVVPITPAPVEYLSIVIPDLAWGSEDYPRVSWNSKLQSLQSVLWVPSQGRRQTRLESWERLLERQLMPRPEDCDPTEVVAPVATQIRKRRVSILS